MRTHISQYLTTEGGEIVKNEKMNIQEFVMNCIKFGLEFSLQYYECQTFDEYCLQMILGNTEYIIPTTNEFRLANLWYNVITEYYSY